MENKGENMKKISLIITGLLAVALFIGLGIQVAQYYDNTYAATRSYTKVPLEVPKREKTKDYNGKIVTGSYSYQYHFKFVNGDGEERSIAFELSGDNVEPFKPGEFLEADISKTRVVKGPSSIEKDKIPKTVVKVIEKIQ